MKNIIKNYHNDSDINLIRILKFFQNASIDQKLKCIDMNNKIAELLCKEDLYYREFIDYTIKNPKILKYLYVPLSYQQCLQIVSNGRAIKYIPNKYHTSELCMKAIDTFPMAVKYIENSNWKVYLHALRKRVYVIKFVPDSIIEEIGYDPFVVV